MSIKNLFLGSLFMLCSISYAQIETKLNPEIILIGDTASLQITITVDNDSKVELPALGDSLSTYLEISKIKTDSLKIGRNLNIIQNITLTGFEAGDFLVKSLPIKIDGKTHLSKSFSLQIKDIEIDESIQGLYPIKPIMQQEITWWEKNKKYVYYSLIGVIITLILILIIWLYNRNKDKNKYVSKPLLPPYEEAMENLKKLDQENYLSNQKYYEFYSDLSFIIRRYFERRFEFSATALLSSDLPEIMQEKEYLTEKESQEFSDFLEDSDYAKYARKIPAEEKHSVYRKWIEEIIEKTKPLLEDNELPEHLLNEEKKKLRKLNRS